jgi:hypothetical protein
MTGQTSRYACLGCRQPVMWAVTANSKRLALNPTPDPAGNQAAYKDGAGILRTRQLKDGQDPLAYERRYMPHVATCGKTPVRGTPAPKVLPPNVIPISRAPSKRSPRTSGHPRRP